MKRFLVLIFLIFLPFITFSQVRPRGHYAGLGIEADAVPFLSGGYHGSLWWGYNHIRVRGVVAKTEIPDFMNTEGFSDNIINQYGMYGDYFFKKKFEGGWLTTGGEYWDGSVTNIDDFATTDYTTFVLALGAGYAFKFWKDFYVSPGFAMKIAIVGDKDIEVGNLLFSPNTITPEISLKFGWHLFI